mgnify:CR=1 FL=1
MARRSVLFSPGDEGEKLRKAAASEADVIVYDLEDAVVPDAKSAARETVREALADVHARGFPFVIQYTITAYPRALETSVIRPEHAIGQMRDLAAAYGPDALVWRYDPVLFTSLPPPDWHRRNFADLAAALEGTCDEVVFSVATIYRKTKRNTDAAAREHGFAWWDPPAAEKTELEQKWQQAEKARGPRGPDEPLAQGHVLLGPLDDVPQQNQRVGGEDDARDREGSCTRGRERPEPFSGIINHESASE